MKLAEKKCASCQHLGAPLEKAEIDRLMPELRGWTVENGLRLVKIYKTLDFAESLALANKIAEIAEEEGHHPDLLVRWAQLKIDLWTHVIHGLSESDFILAAKIDRLAP